MFEKYQYNKFSMNNKRTAVQKNIVLIYRKLSHYVSREKTSTENEPVY